MEIFNRWPWQLKNKMQGWNIVEALPTPEQYNRLRRSIRWKIIDALALEKTLSRSLYGVCAFMDEEIIGMSRVIGDGGLVFYIQDMIVRPEYQGFGIGAAMMKCVMSYIESHAYPEAIVGLMSSRGREGFYKKFGFVNRPGHGMGSGMTRFVNDQH